MLEAGKKDAELILHEFNKKFIEDCLEDFLSMLDIIECEPPFEINSTSELIWNELYNNSALFVYITD